MMNDRERIKEIILYLVVGVLTTLVSWTAKFLWNYVFFANTSHPTVMQNFILSAVNWIAGVAFAYPVNRKWVFKSENPDILKECSQFIASRVLTLGLDVVVMQILVNILGFDVFAGTIIAAIGVVVANYVISKLVVFRK